MVEWANQALFTARFIARVRAARALSYSELEMEMLLGLPKGHYKNYETHSLLPHHLILRFCLFTGIEVVELFGGYASALHVGNGGGEK
jgi:hypothetical protein